MENTTVSNTPPASVNSPISMKNPLPTYGLEKKPFIGQTRAQKVLDFFIGLIGVWILQAITIALQILLVMIMQALANTGASSDVTTQPANQILLSLAIISPFILQGIMYILAFSMMILSFTKKRKFIGIGILFSGFIIPMLLVGGCFLVVTGISSIPTLFQ